MSANIIKDGVGPLSGTVRLHGRIMVRLADAYWKEHPPVSVTTDMLYAWLRGAASADDGSPLAALELLASQPDRVRLTLIAADERLIFDRMCWFDCSATLDGAVSVNVAYDAHRDDSDDLKITP